MQDEIARKIAEALRITLSPQEQEALAAKPTENLQAYDLYLRGKSYARRLTRQDLEFALQMFENAVALDPSFALAYAAIADTLRAVPLALRRARQPGSSGPRPRASRRARSASDAPGDPGGRGWILYAEGRQRGRDPPAATGDRAQARLRGRLLPARPGAVRRGPLSGGGRHRRRRRSRPPATTTTSTCRSRTRSARSARTRRCATSGSGGSRRSRRTSRRCPRTRAPASCSPSTTRTWRRVDDAMREAQPRDDAAAERRDGALQRGLRLLHAGHGRPRRSTRCARPGTPASGTPTWARRDPDLALLHGDPEFESLYPKEAGE